ncbi:MAG: methyltransferase domain-containing protein [Candidatus Omnitrophica bacterium]|nr:methyltransferase domain-containing protein [Candidatus Omnitrophota bacterium]
MTTLYKRFLSAQYIVLVLWAAMTLAAYAQEESRQQHRFNPQSFENDSRSQWQKVDQVIQAIGLEEGDSIADIGGGSGYFSRPFARAVGPMGVVYCCDIATNLLEYLQKRAREENLFNIVTVYAALDRPMLPLQSLDHIFFCNTNHHLENRVDYYKGLHSILKPGGRLIVVDWKKEGKKTGPPPGHCVAQEIVIQEMKLAGWKLQRQVKDILENQYFLIFIPEES